VDRYMLVQKLMDQVGLDIPDEIKIQQEESEKATQPCFQFFSYRCREQHAYYNGGQSKRIKFQTQHRCIYLMKHSSAISLRSSVWDQKDIRFDDDVRICLN
jgi:hypothetical protein